MTFTLHKLNWKIFAALILPIFLFGAVFVFFNEQRVDIVFGLKDPGNSQTVLAKYPFQSHQLVYEAHNGLQTVYSGRISRYLVKAMQSDNVVEYVQPNRQLAAATIITNDPYFTVDSTQDEKQWYLARVKIPEAWELSRGSSNVTIAVIDTGIHASHIELNDGRIIEGYDTIKNETIPANSNSDDNGHGTAVAGVIGAIPNNGRGIAGVNQSVKIMPIKALHADGTGTVAAVAAGIVWASDHGAQIINLSLGGPGFGADAALNNAISYAFNRGVLIVSAAGNDLADQGSNLDTKPVYPICSDLGSNMVLGVAATDVSDRKANFSNFGINCVDVSAPGKKILTTAYLPSDPANNVLIYGSGTSLATPIVSAMAALVKSASPNLSNVELRNVLLRSTDNIDAVNQDNCLGSSCNGFLGKGRINALKALSPLPASEGSLIRESVTGRIYLISGSTKRFISSFVFNQRGFSETSITNEVSNQLAAFPAGPALPPLEGTLIKNETDPTVYVIEQEFKRPLTYLVFITRGYSFANVYTLSSSEVADVLTGEWAAPYDGTMVLIKGDPTVYVMNQGVRRAVTYFIFTQRQLSFAKVISVTQDEFLHIPAPGDSYWLPPLEGTLVKSAASAEVSVIENGTRRPLSYNAFVSRGYKFSSIKILPQAEIEVIAPGSPIL